MKKSLFFFLALFFSNSIVTSENYYPRVYVGHSSIAHRYYASDGSSNNQHIIQSDNDEQPKIRFEITTNYFPLHHNFSQLRPQPNFDRFNSQQFAAYFNGHGWTQEQILNNTTWYLNNEFVTAIKKL